jgi:putative ABC transport system substrate-binding protein
VAGQRAFAEAGGLMALGAIPEESYRRLAYCVERLLAGVPPGSLPVDQAMRMHFVVNLRAARALKATILPSLLGRADDVIE